MNLKALQRILLLGILLCAAARAETASQVSVAAAANLTYVLAPLNAAFAKADPAVTVTCEIGASGSLVAQISNGAPYDVFLSADMDFPRRLVASGGADGASLVTFAFGRLVLWTTRRDLRLASVEAVVRDPSVRKIAVANPRSAPYGRAAEEVLAALGLSAEATPKTVFGENITQTAQFVSSGNADAGFVAYSLVVAPNLREKGLWIEVPASLYKPIAQGAVLTKKGASNPAARCYLQFLAGPEARAVFAKFGYGLP
jgi:molybdate transport system substrate-binding protein